MGVDAGVRLGRVGNGLVVATLSVGVIVGVRVRGGRVGGFGSITSAGWPSTKACDATAIHSTVNTQQENTTGKHNIMQMEQVHTPQVYQGAGEEDEESDASHS